MPVLRLGVVEIPYADTETVTSGKRRKYKVRKVKGTTTGDVADYLEAKYHVVETFYEFHETDIAAALEAEMQIQVDNLMMGGPVRALNLLGATEKIKNMFDNFLSSGEMEHAGIPGVPTKAALAGIRHGFKRPRSNKEPRPSFVDTGMYRDSFTVEVE